MAKAVKLEVHPLVAQDILALDDEALQRLAFSKIKKLRDGGLHGTSLEMRKSTGDLSDCFKILFDTRHDIPPRFRIVYRNLHRGVEVVAVEVLSVGERYELEKTFLSHTGADTLRRDSTLKNQDLSRAL